MAITNNNKTLIDRPMWEQLAFAPAASAAGTCMAEDGSRFIYTLFSATSFWRYDSWADCWQQLANPPSGTVGLGTNIRYTACIGSQTAGGEIYGSVFALIAAVSAPAFAIYDIATNVWTALAVAGLPATIGTDAYIQYPDVESNGWAGAYHAGALNTVTASALANIGATTISVNALPLALAAKAIINFGTLAAPKFAVLTAAAAAGAVSITVSPLLVAVAATNVGYYYDHIYMVGNASNQMYRYTLSTNAWSTTTANAGNAALAGITGAVGAGTSLRRFTAVDANKLTLFRGAATSNVYNYDLVANTWATLTINPATETFTTGTHTSMRSDANGKQTKALIQKDATMRIYEMDIQKMTLKPIANQYLITTGAAVVGDKSAIMRSADGIDFYYVLLHTSQYMVRTPLFF